jgi:hypothetical protein
VVSFRFRGGFLSQCMVGDRAMIPPNMIEHPAWSTIEDIETRNVALLTSPTMRALTRAAITRSELCRLARLDHELPLETAVGLSFFPSDRRQRGRPVAGGIALPVATDAEPVHAAWRAACDVGALSKLRALSVMLGEDTRVEYDPSWITDPRVPPIQRLLASRLGEQLEHFDVVTDGDITDIAMPPLRRFLDGSSRLLRLSLRGRLAPAFACAVRDRGARGIRLILQVDALPDPVALRSFLPAIGMLGRGLRKIEVEVVASVVEDVGWASLVRNELGPIFPEVILPTTVTRRWLSP